MRDCERFAVPDTYVSRRHHVSGPLLPLERTAWPTHSLQRLPSRPRSSKVYYRYRSFSMAPWKADDIAPAPTPTSPTR